VSPDHEYVRWALRVLRSHGALPESEARALVTAMAFLPDPYDEDPVTGKRKRESEAESKANRLVQDFVDRQRARCAEARETEVRRLHALWLNQHRKGSHAFHLGQVEVSRGLRAYDDEVLTARTRKGPSR
jgi:hypothetical protein